MAATIKAQRGKGGGGLNPEGTLIAAPLSHGSNPNSNMAGRRREDDFNLVAGPLGGGNNGIGRRTEDDPNLVSFDWQAGGSGDESFRGKSRSYIVRKGEYAQLGRTKVDAISSAATGVRRLTPRECERLQALPDDWTAHGPDSRRYAALGDAVTSSVAEWIGRRLIQAGAEAPVPPRRETERSAAKT